MRAIILGSGSKGNSTLLIGNNKKILIDVGFSYPQMTKNLLKYGIDPKDIDAILVTHTHKDHVIGLSSFAKKTHVKVYTNSLMFDEVSKIVNEEEIIINDESYSIGEFNINPFPTSHDAKGSCGFIIDDDLSSLVYVTDTGYINKTNLSKMHNKNIYIFESNHDINMLMTGPYPYILKQRVVGDKGHLSNEMAGNYLKEIIGDATKKIILAHLSEINNTHELAIKTVRDIIGNEVFLDAAYQNESMDIGDVND